MARNHTRRGLLYGVSDALSQVAPIPLVVKRDPTTADIAELGTTWVNPLNNGVWVLTSVIGNVANWATSPASGVGIFTDVTITGGVGLDVLTVDDGNIVVTNGDVTLSGLLTAGSATINGAVGVTGNVTITGDLVVTGDFDITDTGSIGLTSTNNAAGAITLTANGGVLETILIRSLQGTSATSLNLNSTAGGITLAAGLATADAINLTTSNAAGGIDIDAGTGGIAVDTTGAFSIDGAAASNVTVTGAGIDLTLASVLGSVVIASSEAAVAAIGLTASDAAGGIDVNAGTGGITIDSTGAISIDGGAASNFTATGAGIDLTLSSVGGSVAIASDEAIATAISLTASNAAGGLDLNAGTGGATLDTTGAFSIDGAAASNVTVTGAGIDLTLASVLGSVLVSSTEDAALAIRLYANGGVSETIQLHSDQGTGVGSINLLSDVGGITLAATGLASADAINLEAPAGGIDMDAALQINIASSQSAVDAIRIVASAGGIDIDAVGVATEDINITNTGASVVVVATEAAADAIVLNASNAAGGIDLLTGGGEISISSAGNVTMLSVADTQASPSATSVINARVGSATFTGFTTAAGSAQVFTITNSVVTATSEIFVSAANEGANDAQMTVTRVNRGSGTFGVTLTNNGAAALNGDVNITFWVIR